MSHQVVDEQFNVGHVTELMLKYEQARVERIAAETRAATFRAVEENFARQVRTLVDHLLS